MENKKKLITGLIIVILVIIVGFLLLKGSKPKTGQEENKNIISVDASIITAQDHTLGDSNAKVKMIEYADYQCPFCGKFHTETTEPIIEKYVKTGKVQFVYRDFAFLGPESFKSAEAVWCAGDQGKYWEFHNYLFTHQDGENRGTFSDKNLKSFAKELGLDANTFDTCLDSGKYTQTIKDSTAAASAAGVKGTPKSFIVKDGKIIDSIDGAYPLSAVTEKLEAALK